MIITAFDLATATGVCDGVVGGKPRLWTWFLKDAGDSRGARFHALHGFLTRYFAQEPCDGVVYEAPMPLGVVAGPKKKGMTLSEANVTFARGCIGILEERCHAHGKSVEALSVQDARQSVLGWRINKTNEPTKKRVVREMATLYKIDADNDNETDAAVLWYYAGARANPRLAIAMTPLFSGAS